MRKLSGALSIAPANKILLCTCHQMSLRCQPQAKVNEVCRVEKTLCYQSDLDLTCSFIGCVWSKRTIIRLTFDGPA